MQGAPRRGQLQRPPGGRGPGPLPTGQVLLVRTTTPCGREQRTPPVGEPTRGRGVSTVRKPESPAPGATEEFGRCMVRHREGLSSGRQWGRAEAPPDQAGRAAANHSPLREGAEDTHRRSAHKGAGR